MHDNLSYFYIYFKIFVKIIQKVIGVLHMLDFSDIMSRIKKILHKESGERILDKDLATALGFDPSYYAVIKKRHKIPYKAIALFANEKNLSLNWIFFNKTIP